MFVYIYIPAGFSYCVIRLYMYTHICTYIIVYTYMRMAKSEKLERGDRMSSSRFTMFQVYGLEDGSVPTLWILR